MFESVLEIAEKDEYCRGLLEEFEEPIRLLLTDAHHIEELTKMFPELAKYVPKEMVLKLNSFTSFPIDEIKYNFKLDDFDEWFEERYGVAVDEASWFDESKKKEVLSI